MWLRLSGRLHSLLLLLATGDLAAAADLPKGHLQRFGSWTTPKPVKTVPVEELPSAEDFFNNYATANNSYGIPVVFKGAASHMDAMRWSDEEYLRKKHGQNKVKKVEYERKETRAGGEVKELVNQPLSKFLDAYKKKDIYMVTDVPKGMNDEVEFMPFFNCGGHLNYLDSSVIWMSRGGSFSVVHYDDQDNLHCQVSGKKTFILMHPTWKEEFEKHPNSNKNRFGWVDTERDRKVPGYGAFMGKLDQEAVDLVKYPGWRDVDTYELELSPGDCLYLPFQWYHHVRTAEVAGVPNIGFMVWYWRPHKFKRGKSCDESVRFSYGDCTWGYEPEQGGHIGGREKSTAKNTKCSNKRRLKRAAQDAAKSSAEATGEEL